MKHESRLRSNWTGGGVGGCVFVGGGMVLNWEMRACLEFVTHPMTYSMVVPSNTEYRLSLDTGQAEIGIDGKIRHAP